MKEITLRISEKNLSFFMELVNQLGIEVVNDDIAIPKWQQEQVKLAKQEILDGIAEFSDWNSLKKELFDEYDVK